MLIQWPILRKLKTVLVASALAAVLTGVDLQAGNQTTPNESTKVPEYVVKAAMLYHFAKFTKWPDGTFADPESPIRFCVLGKDPFGSDLDSLVGHQIRKRDILTTRIRKVRHASECHLLFIAKSEAHRIQSVLQSLDGQPILTIADMDGFARNGGIIQLKIREETIRFQINTGVASKERLNFSAQLLMLADIISGETTLNRLDAISE